MHSLKFTLQNYPENIQIREHNRRVTEATCVYCHGNFVEQIKNDSNHRARPFPASGATTAWDI